MDAFNKIRLAVIMGGPSPEHDISLSTGAMILQKLDRSRFEPFEVTAYRDGSWSVKGNRPLSMQEALEKLAEEADAAFIAMHGEFGEDGQLQGLLEQYGVRYTGSGVASSMLAIDKLASNREYEKAGLAVPEFVGFTASEWGSDAAALSLRISTLGMPVIVKPARCGSSVGMSVVRKEPDIIASVGSAIKYDDNILVQRFVSGTEVTCGVLERKDGAVAFPPTEIVPRTSDFFDFSAKYQPEASYEITPARLSDDILEKVRKTALDAHKVLGCSGISRTDMMVSGDSVYILETNTIPGMTKTSLYPQGAAAYGLKFEELLGEMVDAALRK